MTEELDLELARWLRARTTLRFARDRDPSPLDETSMALRRIRSSLSAMHRSSLVTMAYRWAIRIARELEAIEQLDLDGVREWARYEAFAPFALAFFDRALAPRFAEDKSMEVIRLRREFDAVLTTLTLAMISSALAA
jgi:hypothetical protein